MFVWDFLAGTVLDQILDWIYARVVETFGLFFSMMNDMGAKLFDFPWTQAVVAFFSRFGWALYAVGLVMAVFEYAIESQSGRSDAKGVALGAIKGFLAASLFSTVPVALYRLCVTLQLSLTADLTQLLGNQQTGIAELAAEAVNSLLNIPNINPLFGIVLIILLGYSVIKVFFANLKRGGILLIQIAVGSLHLFGIPRGFSDGFSNWCKQVIGLCLTTFLQSTLLVAGLMIFKDDMLIGTGVVLAAGEVPRIAGAFGLDSSTRVNVMSAAHTTQMVVNATRAVTSALSA